MDGLVDELIEKLDNFLGRILFMIERLVCLFISWLQQLFNVFTGVKRAQYNGKDEYLIDVFFGNSVVNAVYWGMAAIGIVMAFMFAIIAVAKKSVDLDDKMRQSHGQILRSLLRSIIIILSLSIFMTVTNAFTTKLMDAVNAVFNTAPQRAEDGGPITFTNEQFAAMSRIFNTVGNYSLNPSYNNRYNLNACYNEIRSDLQYLADTGVFNRHYDLDENGKETNTWQSVLQELALAADYTKEQPVDTYNEGIANALNHCMQVLKTDNSFHAMQSYDRTREYSKDDVRLDRILFLCGTMGIGNDAAAKNEAYNANPSMTDNVRGPYYMGDKDLYDLDQVNEDFHISFSRMNYLLIYLAGCAIIVNMAVIIVNCIVRIFNLLFLYFIAPPIIATAPLDDGGKFKQWLTAFIIQAFSVFATVISMRVFLIFIPIVMSPNLQLVENSVVSTIGKLVMIWAGTVAIEKANGLLTGILADNAGWQSIMAGSTAQDVKGSSVGRLANAATSKLEAGAVSIATAPVSFAAGKAAGLAKGTVGAVGRVAALPFRPLVGAVKNTIGNVSDGFKNTENEMSNALVESGEYKQQKAQSQAQSKERQEAAQERKEQKQFRNMMIGFMTGQNPPNSNGNVQPPPPRQNQPGQGQQPAQQPVQPGQGQPAAQPEQGLPEHAQPGNEHAQPNRDQPAQPEQAQQRPHYNEVAQNLFGVDAEGRPMRRNRPAQGHQPPQPERPAQPPQQPAQNNAPEGYPMPPQQPAQNNAPEGYPMPPQQPAQNNAPEGYPMPPQQPAQNNAPEDYPMPPQQPAQNNAPEGYPMPPQQPAQNNAPEGYPMPPQQPAQNRQPPPQRPDRPGNDNK